METRNMELELAIVQARKSPMISTLCKDDVMKMISAGISHSAMVRGQDISVNGKSFITEEVYKEIFGKYKDLRIDEILIIFRNGVYGRYGSYFGINAFTIVGWFDAYMSSDDRYEAKKKEKTAPSILIPYDESEEAERKRNDDAMRNSALRFYRESQANNGVYHAINGLKSRVYDYLVKIGKIKNSEERVSAALEEVKENVRREASKMSRGMNQINSVLEMASSLGDNSLIPQAKARVLDKFYKALYDTGRELRL